MVKRTEGTETFFMFIDSSMLLKKYVLRSGILKIWVIV